MLILTSGQIDSMAVSSYSRTADNDVRVQDYVDDKLQTLADLESLDSLLDNVQQQHELLRVQVSSMMK